MSSVTLHYRVQYLECDLADERVECKPVLRVYYDSHFGRTEKGGGIHTLHLDEHDFEKTYSGNLKAQTNALMSHKFPATACIGFAQYAQRRNEYDMSCYTNAGTGHVSMGDIYNVLVKQGQKQYVKTVPLLMETTRLTGDPVMKGVIKFSVNKCVLSPQVGMIQRALCPLGAPIAQISGMLETFIERRVMFEKSMVDTWPGIKNVRAPMDISSAGGELIGKCFVPIEGFAIEEPFESNIGYFENAYRQVMIRRNLNPDTDLFAMDRVHRAEIMAEVCTYAAQSFDYISDTVDRSNRNAGPYNISLRIGFEDFNNMGTTLSGDCEDGFKLTQLIFAFLKSLINVLDKLSKSLRELVEIAQFYIYFGTLATVHGAKAEDQTEHIGAHMYGLLLPLHQVKQALSNNEMGAQLLSKLPIGKSEGLPTLFCEGTGRIRPLGPGPVMSVKECVRSAAYVGALNSDHPMCHDPLVLERRLIGVCMKSKGGLKTEIPHDYGAPSNFYLGNLLLITNEWLKLGYNVGAFICGNVDKSQGLITRGAKFVDVINQMDTFAMIPCEPLPQPIMDVTREAVSLRAPPRPFEYDDSNTKDAGARSNKELDRLKSAINNLRRKGESPFGSVDIFMRDHQFNAASISRMIQDLKQIGPLYKVDYQMQPITNTVHTYRVMLFLDHEHTRQEIQRLQNRK